MTPVATLLALLLLPEELNQLQRLHGTSHHQAGELEVRVDEAAQPFLDELAGEGSDAERDVVVDVLLVETELLQALHGGLAAVFGQVAEALREAGPKERSQTARKRAEADREAGSGWSQVEHR